MQVTEFTPWAGLFGGMLIGLSAGLMFLLAGRISGLSGIAAGLFTKERPEIEWRAAFICGLWVGALAFTVATGRIIPVDAPESLWIVAAGGLLVGLGTRMGSGCTAGHGICGISRLSKRSLVATAVFFVAAIATVFVVRHGSQFL
tara:strand:- start:100997 stop:101431 length:435 start_codon:yes stop_codon:yes gene_type:complete